MNVDNKEGNRTRTGPFWILAGVILLCVLLSAAQILTEETINDEHMYLSAAKMLDGRALYRDYAFMQTPYMVYLYKWAMDLFPAAGMLWTARMLKLLLVILTLLVFSRLCLRFSRCPWMTSAFLWLLVASAVFRSDLQYARNYQLPLLLVLCCIQLIDRERATRSYRFRNLFFAGVCLGLAIGVKLTFVLPGLALAAALIFSVRPFRTAVRDLIALTSGAVFSLIPAVLILLRAGWERLMFNLVDYHHLNILWRQSEGYDAGMDAAGKTKLGVGQLLEVSNLGILLLTVVMIASLLIGKRERPANGRGRFISLSFLIAATILLYLIPTPAWIWYLSPLWVTLFLTAAEGYGRLQGEGIRRWIHFTVMLLVGATILVNSSREYQNIEMAIDPEMWTPRRIKSESFALKSELDREGVSGRIATLRPLYALEAGLPVYLELVSADFGYRVGDYLERTKRKTFRISSVSEISQLLQNDPPAAIVCGLETELDKPIAQFAVENGYRLNRRLIRGARVYIRTHDDKKEER